jgi:hypothetical protein
MSTPTGAPLFKSVKRLDRWLRERRFRWRTLWITFAVLVGIAVISISIDGGLTALIAGAIYLFFGVRYIRPNIGLPFR